MADYLIAAVLVIGGVFGLIGSFGLLKLNDPMKRLHAPTKASTIGVGTALIASSIYAACTWRALRMKRSQVERFDNLPFATATPPARHEITSA